jgi:predicted dinucleotide-binding enzyme
MDVTIIGTGNMARGIGTRLLAGGHDVTVLGKEPGEAEAVVEGQVAGQPLDVFLASDDGEAKAIVTKLVEDGGLRPIDAGPLGSARELEAAGLLHMSVQDALGTGFGSSLKILD